VFNGTAQTVTVNVIEPAAVAAASGGGCTTNPNGSDGGLPLLLLCASLGLFMRQRFGKK